MIFRYFKIILILFVFGCSSSNIDNKRISDEIDTHKSEFLKVTSILYKKNSTGDYYFKFKHIPIEGQHIEDRFIPVLNSKGKHINDIDEDNFKLIFNYYVDSKYMFEVVNNYDQYEVRCFSIDRLPEACYYENSNYRDIDGMVEYYQGKSVSKCNIIINDIFKLQQSRYVKFNVLDIKDYDCCILDNKIFIDGCYVEHIDSITDILLRNKIQKREYKQRYCFP